MTPIGVTVDYEQQPLALATGQQHTVKLPPQVFRARLTGLLFETDKAFLLPAAMAGIRGLRRYYDEHPGLQVLVTGHTDTVGDAGYNEGLAGERAVAVAAFLRDDVDGWLPHYAGTPRSRAWGTREDQHMLTALPADGAPYYAGPVDGSPGPRTTEAVRRFQREHGLAEDGVAGPTTRRALITAYMALDGTSLPAGTPVAVHGCGEAHPAVPTPDGTDEPANRRVEVFLFEGPIEPPPRDPCRACPEYAEWLRRTVHTIDLGLAPAWLDVAIVDGIGRPLADVAIDARGPTSAGGLTAKDGTLRLRDLLPGRYRVTARHERFDPAGTEIELRAGEPTVERVQAADPPPQALASPAASPPPTAVTARRSFADDGGDGGTGASPPGTSQLQPVGDNRLVGWLLATLHVIIAEAPATLRDHAREHFGPGTDQPWVLDRLRVVVTLAGAMGIDPIVVPIFPMTDGSKRGHTGMVWPTRTDDASVGLKANLSVDRTGPHAAPIIWQLDPPTPLGDTGWASDKLNEVTRTISGRSRISLWANGPEIIGLDKNKQMFNTHEIEHAAGLIDDVSLIAGLFNNHRGTSPPTFTLSSAAGSAGAALWYRKIIDECHRAGVQCLAGWALPDVITEGTKPGKTGYSASLNAWLRYLYGLRISGDAKDEAKLMADLATFASNLVAAADTVAGWDGISFDLESIGFPISKQDTSTMSEEQAAVVDAEYEERLKGALPVFRTVVADMYRAAAQRLALTNRICAVTVGGNHGDDLAQKTPTAVAAVPFARVHSFDMAKGAPNLILRAMAYDNAGWEQPTPAEVAKGVAGHWRAPENNADPAQLAYHRGVIDFALDEKRLQPSQFQLGLKTLALPSAAENTKLPNPMLGGNVAEPARLVARATQLLRPARVGAAWFTLGGGTSFWQAIKDFDAALNGPPAIAPGTYGQPMHVPHDTQSLARLAPPPTKAK